ncbi:MAG: hypothetical protein E6H90_11120 [Chloroflexi bacterium]|nr:MAG: hypothetical protein E6I46_10495 [Chloroflexota bacterium]TMF23260.1 MAG: hypothetical protein E6I31_05835 [Chloroflexota bacterium]TMF47577.1 MAG: hypothetical protein E6I24_07270 [Chloroflexota bacterium]TMG19116.1 MAG: hypothetical protein E6H98_03425 [Chloroflexota bacterium]TMG44275.1 MAG: hypothetical protein E6H90_11120 [Chloroflexota bacterium]
MSQGVIKIALAMAFAALLPSCFGAQVNTRPIGPVALAYNFPKVSPTPEPQPSVTVGQVSTSQGAVEVRGYHEPGDWAHRNYCGAGATQVLLSAWMSEVPDIETVARASKLNPNRGEYGADATNGINQFLNPMVLPVLGQPRYQAAHVTTLDEVQARIVQDILDQQAIVSFGHGVPVMLQTMTKTMPGWNHWNATHMITVFAFDFSHNDPALDTITYAETPSPLAGYRGPDFQTISVKALWVAMQAYLREFPQDPMNVIS